MKLDDVSGVATPGVGAVQRPRAVSRSVAAESSDAWPLECPVCTQPLSRGSVQLACPNGHTFDVAREGYVNLLVSQHATRGVLGDTAEMLNARRRFHDSGWFEPLVDWVAKQVGESLGASDPNGASSCVLDVGCGDGYFIGTVAERCTREGTVFVGADVSKAAAKSASRRFPQATFIVADTNRRIYLLDRTVDVLLDIFAPRNPAEFARVLRPGGVAIVIIPAVGHLAELRAELGLLGIEEDKEGRVVERMGSDLRLADRAEVEFELALPPSAVQDLVSMGPNYWHDRTPSPDVLAEQTATHAAFVALRFENDATC